MPELPEVETVRRTLLPRIRGMRVAVAKLLRRDVLVVPGDPPGGFARQRGPAKKAHPRPLAPADLLEGCTITDIFRRGKQLAIIGRGHRGADHVLVVQLGMSGQLFMLPGSPLSRNLPTHVHALWELTPRTRTRSVPDQGVTVVFRDPRRFGGIRVLRSQAELEAHWSGLGPDALDLTAQVLLDAARGSSRAIKALLMDQAAIAGVGNIYADEALFRAGVRPSRAARRLKPAEAVQLAEAVRAVLSEAVEARGSTLRDYRDANGAKGGFQIRHAVYGRGGRPCIRCGRKLRSGVFAQRTTVWCSHCQK